MRTQFQSTRQSCHQPWGLGHSNDVVHHTYPGPSILSTHLRAFTTPTCQGPGSTTVLGEGISPGCCPHPLKRGSGGCCPCWLQQPTGPLGRAGQPAGLVARQVPDSRKAQTGGGRQRHQPRLQPHTGNRMASWAAGHGAPAHHRHEGSRVRWRRSIFGAIQGWRFFTGSPMRRHHHLP